MKIAYLWGIKADEMDYSDEKPHEEELTAHETMADEPVTPGHGKGTDMIPTSKRLIRILYNKFFLVVLFFLAWITFFDSNNLISRLKVNKELRQMKQQKEYYLQEIAINKQIREQLTRDMDAIERYGREQYLMKRDQEDVFLIINQ